MHPCDAAGRCARPVLLLVIAALSLSGCGKCQGPDVDAMVAQWRTTLATGLPTGSTVEAAEGFFATHGLQAGYSSVDHGMGARIPIPPDTGFMCDLVTTDIFIDCSFGADDRLDTCSVQAVATGP